MSSLNPTKQDQVLRASCLLSLGWCPEMPKSVCFLRIPQSWADFLHMLTCCLQRLALTVCRGTCREPAVGPQVHG